MLLLKTTESRYSPSAVPATSERSVVYASEPPRSGPDRAAAEPHVVPTLSFAPAAVTDPGRPAKLHANPSRIDAEPATGEAIATAEYPTAPEPNSSPTPSTPGRTPIKPRPTPTPSPGSPPTTPTPPKPEPTLVPTSAPTRTLAMTSTLTTTEPAPTPTVSRITLANPASTTKQGLKQAAREQGKADEKAAREEVKADKKTAREEAKAAKNVEQAQAEAVPQPTQSTAEIAERTEYKQAAATEAAEVAADAAEQAEHDQAGAAKTRADAAKKTDDDPAEAAQSAGHDKHDGRPPANGGEVHGKGRQ